MLAHRGKYARTQEDGSPLQAKERGLRTNQPCPFLDLELPVHRTVRKQTSVV
jgi:hypothetical protein